MARFSSTERRFGRFRTRLLSADNGAGDARTVIMFHGWSDSADTWKPLMRELWNDGARLLAVDLPGFGRADPAAPGLQLPQLIDFVHAVLVELGPTTGQLYPVGQSLGARTMLTAVARGVGVPIPVAFAVGPAPLELPGWQRVLVRNGSLAPAVSRIAEDQSDAQRIREVVNSYKRSCFAEPDKVPDEVYADYASHLTPARAATHIEALRLIGVELAQPLALSSIDCPVEIAWGALDRMAPISGAEAYLRAIPDARLHRYEGAGHHAHLERSTEIAALIRSHLPGI